MNAYIDKLPTELSIIMLGDYRGCPEGFSVGVYDKGKVYSTESDDNYTPHTLACAFLQEGKARIYTKEDKPYNASKFLTAYTNGSDDFKQGALQVIDFIIDHPDILEDAKNQVRSVFVDDVLRFTRKSLPNPHMQGAPLMSAVRQSKEQ